MPPIVTRILAGEEFPSHTIHHPLLPDPSDHAACNQRNSKMTRGRKKDLSIPPTRALVQQRDYRARRAQYVNDLEDRCRKAEEENMQLRKELDAARAGQVQPIAYDPQTAQASSELMHNLTLASASLSRFQQLAFPEQHSLSSEASGSLPGSLDRRLPPLDTVLHGLRPASFPSPAPSPPYVYPSASTSAPRNYNQPSKKRLYREDSPHSPPPSRVENLSSRPSPSPSLDSECCLGMVDCRDLVEPEDDDISDGSTTPASRMSHLRSISTGGSSSSYRPLR